MQDCVHETIVPAHLCDADLNFGPTERQILRGLAGQVAALAARPGEESKRQLWRRHNALQSTRPLVFCDPENSWHEIIPADQLMCERATARQWEWQLRRQVFWGEHMGDDYTIEPYFDVPHVRSKPDWGLKEKRVGGQDGGAYRWEAPVKTEADLDKLHFPQIQVDLEATERLAGLAGEILGDLLAVRIKTSWWWSQGLTQTLIHLRGLEQVMYDLIDRPNLVHQLLTILRDGTQALLDGVQERGLLSHNCDGSYVGSGGLGWSDELPQADFDGSVRLRDMWGFAESQETVGVSPKMFAEFIFPYQLPLLEHFGLNCYGCCEPLDKRWRVIEQIPRLRRVSVSPWSDLGDMADKLGDRYVYSIKPNPSDLALDALDEEQIRAKLRESLRLTRDCRVEVIMKDTHTIRNDPQRVARWVQIAREEAKSL